MRATYTLYIYQGSSGDEIENDYCKASFMCESRATVPGLNLISEDDLYFAFVSTTGFYPRLHDPVNG